jgi:threonyl-tRNA synthetase
MLVVGDRESAERTVSVRTRSGGDQGARPIAAFIEAAQEEIRAKKSEADSSNASAA